MSLDGFEPETGEDSGVGMNTGTGSNTGSNDEDKSSDGDSDKKKKDPIEPEPNWGIGGFSLRKP